MIKKNFFLLLSYMKKSKMSNHGKRPPHVFAEFITPVRQIMINKNNCLAVCNGCISKKGFNRQKIIVMKKKIKFLILFQVLENILNLLLLLQCSNAVPMVFQFQYSSILFDSSKNQWNTGIWNNRIQVSSSGSIVFNNTVQK